MQKYTAQRQYYVYTHARPDGRVFYVGKGFGRRCFKLNRKHNVHHQNVVAKYGKENIVITIYKCTSEQTAFSFEQWLIASHKNVGTVLCNQTLGGEGVSGRIESEATKQKRRTTCQNRTPEQQAALTVRLSRAVSSVHARRSAEDKARISARVVAGSKATYARKTADEREALKEQKRRVYAELPKSIKDARIAKWKHAMAIRTPAAVAALNALRSVNTKKMNAIRAIRA